MGHFGKVTQFADLPSDKQLLGYIRKAAQLNRDGVKKPQTVIRKERSKAPLLIPSYLAPLSRRIKKPPTTFDRLSYSHKKEYLEWITEAKREETRQKRMKTAIGWLAEGKPRNWKYM